MMRILVINGSPKRTGNTAGLIGKIVEGARAGEPDVEISQVSLNDLQYRGCQGCLACLDDAASGCSQSDALTPVLRALAEADAVILGTPVYMSGVAGQTKLFLDRLCAFRHYRKAAAHSTNPRAIVAITQGWDDEGKYSSLVGQVAGILANQCGATVESIVGGGFISGKSCALSQDAADRAVVLGRWLVGHN